MRKTFNTDLTWRITSFPPKSKAIGRSINPNDNDKHKIDTVFDPFNPLICAIYCLRLSLLRAWTSNRELTFPSSELLPLVSEIHPPSPVMRFHREKLRGVTARGGRNNSLVHRETLHREGNEGERMVDDGRRRRRRVISSVSRGAEKLGGVLAISMNYVWGLVKVYRRIYSYGYITSSKSIGFHCMDSN